MIVDSRIIYTTDPEALWRGISRAASSHDASLTGAAPEVAVDLGSARLYIGESAPSADVPQSALALGEGLREFVVDIHNAREADRFLAAALADLSVMVDDDQGNVMSAEEFATRATP